MSGASSSTGRVQVAAFVAVCSALVISCGVYAGSLSATPMKIDWQMVNNATIMINVSCACTGWASVAWGKPGPAHAGMDVIQGSVTSAGGASLQDGISSSYSAPSKDPQQDFTIVSSSVTASSIFYSFTRPINTGDTNDVVITDGMYLFYAYTSTATAFSTKHDSKGSAGVNFVTPCSAPATLVNPDGATFQNCIQVDSTRNVRLRWNVVGSSVSAQLEGNVVGTAFAYTVGIRPKKYTGFPASSHPNMGTATDDFVDCWTAGLGGSCGTGAYCIKDGSLSGFNTAGDNSQFTNAASAGNSTFMKYKFTRAFAAVDSKDQTIDTTTDWWLMYSYKGSGPQSSPGQHSSSTGFQYVINFGQNYTCASDWQPGVCNTTVVTTGGSGGSGGGGTSIGTGNATSNSYSNIGMSLTWTPNSASSSISFQFTYPGTGWGGLGFNPSTGSVHGGTEMFFFYPTSAGGWNVQSSWSTSFTTPTANPASSSYVVSGTSSGGNNVLTFSRPYTGSAGTSSYTIPDASSMVALAYGGTATTYPTAITDCNYHGASNRVKFVANLISGGVTLVNNTSGGGGSSSGGSNSGSANANTYASKGMTIAWKPNTVDKSVSFDFTYPGTGWGGIGLNSDTAGVHGGTEMFFFYPSSAGAWKAQSSWSTSKSTPNPNPSDAYVVGGSSTGGNTNVIFARPFKGGAGTTYDIPDKTTLVSIAYGGTANTYPTSLADCNYHGGNKDVFGANLVSGGVTAVKKSIDPGTLYVAVVLAFFGFYSLIRWTYKLFKFTTRRATPIKTSAPSLEPQHRQFYRGSVAVNYKVKPQAGVTFNSDGTPADATEATPLRDEQKIEGFETTGGSKTVTVTAPQKKNHSTSANVLHGIWRARIPKTHIAVSDAVMAVLFIGLNVYFTHIYKDPKFDQYVVWGYMCTANSLLVALPATRNSMLVWVLGVPFDVAITYHRWIGRVAIAQGIAHFITSISFFATGLPKYNYGLGAVIAMMLLFLTSIAPLRRKTFNIFFAAHHVFIAFYVLGSFHSTIFYYYTLAAAAVYGFDRLLRIIWGAYPVKAQVKLLPGNVAKIIFPKHCLAHYEIGQYVFLNFPQIDFFEWHPFTLASGPGEKTNEVDIKALGNFTRKVLALAEVKGGTLWVRQDGPYGHWPFNYARYPNVMALSGGVGVTPCIALLRHIYHINRPNATLDSIVQNVFFVWSCKSEEEIGWFRDELEEIRKKEGRDGYPRLHAYIHVTSNKGDKPLENGLKPGRPNLPQVFSDVIAEMEKDKANSRAFAVTCGPAVMVNESWDLATKHSIGSIRFDYHHETFEF
eukprot:TRINITY_DN1967_c0_g1_i1.p1 TRINITY_DN1967_c0_g1~~TRINITY_DN1967_c0_g1_i1.p1  ORF type:complete len:1315 (+),score=276.51 TRINITY_DN1967_c0_g1_i1:28-3945(+)